VLKRYKRRRRVEFRGQGEKGVIAHRIREGWG
jgi:hypothetical protein